MAISIAQAFLNSVRSTLLDPNGQYWTDSELISYYNVFVTTAISEYPTLLTKTVPFALAAGVEQKLPADGVMFLRAPANVTGEGIIETTAEAMQDADPTWYKRPPAPIVKHVMPDRNDPLVFRVWPPNDGTGQIYVNYSYAPNDAVLPTDNFTLTEAYRDSARNAVLAMAYAKSTDRQDLPKSQYYYALLDKRIQQGMESQLRFMSKGGIQSTPKTSE